MQLSCSLAVNQKTSHTTLHQLTPWSEIDQTVGKKWILLRVRWNSKSCINLDPPPSKQQYNHTTENTIHHELFWNHFLLSSHIFVNISKPSGFEAYLHYISSARKIHKINGKNSNHSWCSIYQGVGYFNSHWLMATAFGLGAFQSLPPFLMFLIESWSHNAECIN